MRNWFIAALLSVLLPIAAGCGGGGGTAPAGGGSALTITISALPDGTQGTAYAATLTATGGTTPYTWTIISIGGLPNGLTLAPATGQISGFPTTVGTSNFTVRCTDAATGSTTKALSITVVAGGGGGGGGGGGSFAWNQITPGGTIPGGRSSHSAIVDPANQRMIMTLGSTGSTSVFSDSFALSLQNGSEAWSVIAAGPTGRWGHTTVYDLVRNRLLLFGGNVGGFVTGNDVWQFTLTPGVEAWSQLSPGGATAPVRVAHGAVYDPNNDRMIVYGGGDGSNFNPSASVLGDVWALTFSGTGAGSWAQLTPSGTAPAARLGMIFVYDVNDQRIIMFGGDTPTGALGDLWELDIATPGSEAWTKLTPAGATPSARSYSAGAYDPIRDSLVLFSGDGGSGANTGDVWELSLTSGSEAWTAVSPGGAGHAARDSHTAVYDAVGRRIIFYGGFTKFPSTPFSDVWALSLP